MNLAEVVHAGWSNRDTSSLSLLDAAQIDANNCSVALSSCVADMSNTF